jgi:hypothetical protein
MSSSRSLLGQVAALLFASCVSSTPASSSAAAFELAPPEAGLDTPLDTPEDIERRGGARQTYIASRVPTPLVIDGKLDEAAWQAAAPTAVFVDIEGARRAAPRQATRARMLWDATYFYIGAELAETDLWATLTERDSIVFQDNDFEVFIDPDGDTHLYYELEINALDTEWDLLLVKPYRDGGPALHGFDTHGLKSAVHLDGTLNDRTDRDTGWTVEIAIPWAALRPLTRVAVPPENGNVWWVNFSRVEWLLDPAPDGSGYTKRKAEDGARLPESNWVWSPQGVIAMHEPESWGLVQFSDADVLAPAADPPVAFEPPVDFAVRNRLREVYHRERAFEAREGRYTTRIEALGMNPIWEGRIEIELTPSGFEATLPRRAVFEDHVRIEHFLWIRADGAMGHSTRQSSGGTER